MLSGHESFQRPSEYTPAHWMLLLTIRHNGHKHWFLHMSRLDWLDKMSEDCKFRGQ